MKLCRREINNLLSQSRKKRRCLLYSIVYRPKNMEKSQNLKVLVPNSSGSAKNRKSKQNVNKPANFKSNYGMSTAMLSMLEHI